MRNRLNYQTNTTGVNLNTYFFDPVASGIIQGVVTNAVAENNRVILNQQLVLAKSQGFTTFELPVMDAFFDVGYANPRSEYRDIITKSILMLSNLNFKMNVGTVIRRQPSELDWGHLIAFNLVENITLSGGTLVGDKLHPIWNGGTSEYSHNISILSSHDINILGVTTMEAMGDGIYLGVERSNVRTWSTGLVAPGKWVNERILIQDCIIDNNARQGISPVDADGPLVINNNVITNTGRTVGTLPMSGIDLESYRFRDPDTGELLILEVIQNVTISNNTFVGNINADLLLYTTNDVQVFNNTFTRGIANTACFNVDVYDNDFVGEHVDGVNTASRTAIGISSFISSLGEQLTYNIKVNNNRISGDYNFGISVGGQNVEITNNTVTNMNTIGISIGYADGALYQNNTVNMNILDRAAYRNFLTASTAKDIVFNNNTGIAPLGFGLRLQSFTGLGTGLTITNSTFQGQDASNREDIQITNSSNITIGAGNTYTTIESTGNTNVIIN